MREGQRNNPRRILIIKPGSLGDIVHALPAYWEVRRHWPEARISWLVDSRWRELMDCVEGLDDVLEFPREQFRGVRGAWRFLKWLGGLGGLRPDLGLDLQGLLRSALCGRAAGAGILVGGSDAREGARFFYHRTASVDSRAHAVERCRAVARAAGVRCEGAPRFPLGGGKRPTGLAIPERFVLVAPFARGKGKSMKAEALKALCRELAPHRVVLVGRGEEIEGLTQNVVSLLNRTTLPELVWLAGRAEWVVAVDSGPSHIAAAVNERVLALHTWSDPRRVGPYGRQCWVWRGGVVWRQDLALKELPGAPGSAPDATEAEEIARWVKEQLASCPD